MRKEEIQADWTINVDTVAQAFLVAVQNTPNAVYCKSASGALTYEQAAGVIQTLSQELRPVVQGKPVALILPNSIAFLIGYFSILIAGGKPALINYDHPAATITKLLKDLKAVVTISDRSFDGITSRKLNDSIVVGMVASVDLTNLCDPSNADDIAAILYSGGTTGLPKQVPHTNAAVVATMARGDWGWPTQANETWLTVAPFTHIYGFLMGVTNPLIRAGSVVIPDRFQPDLIVEMLADEKVTIFGGGPPAIYQAVMASKKFQTAEFLHLRLCPGGGAPFPLDVHKRWENATGLKIYEGYGMTEIAPISINTAAFGFKPGSAGMPVPDTLVEIVDLKSGTTVLANGKPGEIRVKGPHMMTGYACNREETDLTLKHGFVYTGDIGTIDEEGFLTITDRKKSVIFVNGFNVFPREVEELLLTHPAVSGACVVGRTHDRTGETPIAFVTLRTIANEGELADFCRSTLIAYKVPTQINILQEMPMTPARKIDRLALKETAQL